MCTHYEGRWRPLSELFDILVRTRQRIVKLRRNSGKTEFKFAELETSRAFAMLVVVAKSAIQPISPLVCCNLTGSISQNLLRPRQPKSFSPIARLASQASSPASAPMAPAASKVDQELFPHASGAAASLVAAHTAEQPHIFYSGWFCPFVQRAWIVLEEKKIPYEYVEINPYHKSKEFLALNPRGLVPTLGCPRGVDGNETKPLYESIVICEYLNEVFTDPKKHGANLFPEDAYERARCRIWIDFVSTRIAPSFYRFCQNQPHSPTPIQDARAEFLGHLKTFIKAAHPTGPFFLGSQFSMVDVILAPWISRLWILDYFKDGGLGMPGAGKGGEDEGVWQRWRKFEAAVLERKSVKETTSEREHYVKAYQRYAEDKSQSEVAKATRSGRNLP